MPFPLIALAATLLPEIVRLVAGDSAGRVADAVTDAVRTTTGSDDPVTAEKAIAANPQVAADLRAKLAQIAVDQERMRLDAAEKKRAAELAELERRLSDVQGARAAMMTLSTNKDPMRWGAPVVSVVVTLMFVLSLVIFTRPEFKPAAGAGEMLNIVLGTLVAAFTAVVNFWIGSSQGSRDKDATVRALQSAQATQADSALSNQTQQAAAAFDKQAQTTRAIIDGLRQATPHAGAPPVAPAPPAAAPAAAKRRAFEAAVDLVLDKEGGFSNDPRDKGGMTNFGITSKTYAAFHDIEPATVTEAMMRALTREQAVEIYRTSYWNAARCDMLPPGVDLCVFDFGVNAGVRTAVRLLQDAVGVTKDGSIGPITLAAVAACVPETLIRQYADKRLAYYRSLADFDAFGRGWTIRTTSIRDASIRLAGDAQPAAVLA